MLGPAADRLREAGKLRPGVTTEDIVTLVRMAEVADSPAQRVKAVEIMLDGLIVRRP